MYRNKKSSISISKIGLAIYTVARFLERVNLPISSAFWNTMILISCLIMLSNVLLIKKKVRFQSILLFFILGCFLIVDFIPTGAHEMLYLLIILWSMQGENMRASISMVYKLTAFLTVMVVLLALVKILPNSSELVGNRIRYNVGFYGYDVLPIQYMALVFGYSLICEQKPKLYKVILLELGGVAVFYVTRVRTTFVIMSVYVLVWLLFSYKPIKNWKRMRILYCVPYLCLGFSFLAGYLFRLRISFIWMINSLVMFRISMQNYMIDKYGISLVGANVPWAYENENKYMYVDNSYINILLTWGVIGLVMILLLYTFLIKYAIDIQYTQLLLVTVSVLLLGLMWNVLMIFPYVEFILYASLAFDGYLKRRKMKRIRQYSAERRQT